MDPNDPGCSVQELLARQLALVQQTLAFNEAITRRLSLEGKVDLGGIPVPALAVPGPPAAPLGMPARPSGTRDLSEPLLHATTLAVPDRERVLSKGSTMERLGRKGKHAQHSEAQMSIFPNAEDLKNRVVQTLVKPEYRVEDYYSEKGCWQWLARARFFQNAALAVILVNVFWIAYETDNNKADVLCNAPMLFQVMDNLFCAFFVFEITVRFMAFNKKCDALRDAWWVFDFVLVAFMVWETWVQVALYLMMSPGGGSHAHLTILRIVRIMRLTRVARMARLLRCVPELVILVKAIALATRSVVFTLCLLISIIYVFAVLFTQLLSGTEVAQGCFDNVPQAMNCLLLKGVFTEQAEFIQKLLSADWVYYVCMLLYLLLASLTVLNMLIGVLCEVVSVVAQVEREDLLVKHLKQRIRAIMGSFDVNGGDNVTKQQFALLMQKPEAMQALHEVGVDVVALVEYGDFIFRERDELSLGEFLTTVLQFRGTNTATVKDVVDMRKFVSRELVSMERRMVKKA